MKYQPPTYSYVLSNWDGFKMSVAVCSVCGAHVSRGDTDKHDDFHTGTWLLFETFKRLFKKVS